MKLFGAVILDTSKSQVVEWIEGDSIDEVRQEARELTMYDTRSGTHLELYVHESSVEKFKRS